MSDRLLATSAEAVVHDFFRDNSNYFHDLELAAEALRAMEAYEPDDIYATLKARLLNTHSIRIKRRTTEEMTQALRVYDKENRIIYLSEALDYSNVLFQLAHVLCLIEFQDLLNKLAAGTKITAGTSLARCHVELANYFAAAYLMPYEPFLREAESMAYDIERLAARFGVSFEQTCHRLTTLQRPGAQGVPFFFLRVDKAGNVTKRFNSTSFHLAEYGGACPVWKVHMAFRLAGVIIPQFVELPDGDRYFTINRTVDRPMVNFETQDHRLAISLGCELQYAKKLGYAAGFNVDDDRMFSRIGINCHVCPRQACSQRAHQPLFVDLPLDTTRRGKTRYES
jgi:predicted transcriptional regulator